MWPPNNASDLVQAHEGRRHAPYYDSLGFPTNGIGHKLGPKNTPLSNYPMADDATIDGWFAADLALAFQECQRIFGSAWSDFGPARQGALADMAFEMGEAGIEHFHDMIAAIVQRSWGAAAAAAKASLWDRQVPHRAASDEALLAAGTWDAVA